MVALCLRCSAVPCCLENRTGFSFGVRLAWRAWIALSRWHRPTPEAASSRQSLLLLACDVPSHRAILHLGVHPHIHHHFAFSRGYEASRGNCIQPRYWHTYASCFSAPAPVGGTQHRPAVLEINPSSFQTEATPDSRISRFRSSLK